MTHEEILSQLKDIHQAEAPSWWPLAPGYYIVLALVMAIALVFYVYFRGRQRRRLQKTLLSELMMIEKAFLADNDNARLQSAMSALFRRLAFFANSALPKNSELDSIVPVLRKLSRDQKGIDAIIDLLKQDRYQKDPQVNGMWLISISREQIKRCRI